MSVQSIYTQIMGKVKRIYDTYEDRANRMAEDKRQKSGNKADKYEDEFLKRLADLEALMNQTSQQMKKIQKGSTSQFIQNIKIVDQCLKDIRFLLKKKPLNFKINIDINKIIDDTKMCLDAIKKDLAVVKETKFLCCGVDGQKKFKTPMNLFKVVSGKWKMLTLFEPKDGVETFVSPGYNQSDFQFIAEILKRSWPQKEIVHVQKPIQIIKQVKVQVPVGVQPNALHKANEYIYGINKQENLVEGLNIYIQEAEKGNSQASTYLGKVYQDGILLAADIKKAQNYYKKAMNAKEPYAQYRYAMCLIKGKLLKQDRKNKQQLRKQMEEGFKLLKQIAEDPQNPCPQALAELGEIYEFGNFLCDEQNIFTIERDLNKAVNYLQSAKRLKLARASNNLGVLYMNSKLNKQLDGELRSSNNVDDQKIIGYLMQAKQQGFSQANYNLGMIYSKGLLGNSQPDKALQNFYEGGIKGDYKCKIKFAYELMNQTSVHKEDYEEHYHLAVQWLDSVVRKLTLFNQTVETDNILAEERGEALFYLGIFYENGFGVEKSPKKAVNYFLESSHLNYAAAKNKIGDCYFSGYGLELNRQLAVGCYLQAAQQGSSDAMVNLGTVYLNGIPGLVERSYKKAYQNFVSANELDNTNAMIHLSYMYRNGLGVQASQQMARELLQQAAELKDAKALYMLRQMGVQFNQAVLFQQLQNEFFAPPKKINLKQIVPVLASVNKSK